MIQPNSRSPWPVQAAKNPKSACTCLAIVSNVVKTSQTRHVVAASLVILFVVVLDKRLFQSHNTIINLVKYKCSLWSFEKQIHQFWWSSTASPPDVYPRQKSPFVPRSKCLHHHKHKMWRAFPSLLFLIDIPTVMIISNGIMPFIFLPSDYNTVAWLK